MLVLLIYIIVLLLLIMLAILFLRNESRNHLIKHWPKILTMLFVALIGAMVTFLGVYFGDQSNTSRAERIEKQIYTRNFALLLSEVSYNLPMLDTFQRPDGKGVILWKPYDDILKGCLKNPLTVRYVRYAYLSLLRQYSLDIDLLKSNIDLYNNEVIKGTNSRVASNINMLINELICLSWMLQYENQLYMIQYDVVWPVNISNDDEIVHDTINVPTDPNKLLKQIEKYKRRFNELMNLPTDEHGKLRHFLNKT